MLGRIPQQRQRRWPLGIGGLWRRPVREKVAERDRARVTELLDERRKFHVSSLHIQSLRRRIIQLTFADLTLERALAFLRYKGPPAITLGPVISESRS